jgi:5-methylcytosine-specific restriction protein A
MSGGSKRFQSWYMSARWTRRRAHQLREHPFCVMCEADGHAVVATVVDHVDPHRGNKEKFFLGKVQSLCAAHHNSQKRKMESRGLDFELSIGADGLPRDRKHPFYTGHLPERKILP